MLPNAEHKLLGYGRAESGGHDLPLAKAMGFICHEDPERYAQQITELSYLSNTLISGCGFKGSTFQPEEAAQAAFSVCNLGVEYLLNKSEKTEGTPQIDPMTEILKTNHLVKMFQAGWKILFTDVVLYTAKAILEFILNLREKTREPEQRNELIHMSNLLHACICSGRPWAFTDEMDYLLIFLDGKATSALTELLREYPTMADAVCRKGGHGLSPFIYSKVHIENIRNFLGNVLPGGSK